MSPSGSGPELSFQRRRFGEGMMSLASLSPGTVPIGGLGLPDSVDRGVLIAICLRPVSFQSGDTSLQMCRGDVVLLDLSAAQAVIGDRASSWLNLVLPRDVIARRFAFTPQIPTISIGRSAIMGTLFRGSLLKLWQTGSGLCSVRASETVQTLIDVLMDAVAESLEGTANRELSVAQTLMTVSTAVRSGLADPNFDGMALSAAVKMSPRRLAKVLSPVTPADLIRKLRLAEARRLLQGSGGKGLTVTEVARRTGFINLAHFSALYDETFGVPPNHDRT